ncbi:zinc finger, CCHC-type containing protein [Tanacetum coccineum]
MAKEDALLAFQHECGVCADYSHARGWRSESNYTLEAKYMVEDASSKKFLVSNFTNYKMTDSRPVLEQYNEILDFKHTLKHLKEELTLIELGSHLRIEESLKAQDNDKPKGNNVVGPSVVNMVEHNNSSRKPGHLKKDCKAAYFMHDDDVAWWVDSGEAVHVCKDRCWFKTCESLNDGSILHMGNVSTALVHGHGCVDLRFISEKVVSLLNVLHVPNIRKNLVSSSVLNNCGYKQVIESNKFVLSKHGVFIGFGYISNHMFMLNIVSGNIGSAFMSTSKLNDSILWHARLGHVHFKRMQDMSKDGLIPAFDMDTENDFCDLYATPSLGNKKYFVIFIDDASRFCYVYLLHSKDEALDKFQVFKTKVELQQGSLIKRFEIDRGGEYMDTLYFQSIGIIYETTAPYTPQQNGISERKNRVLKEMVNYMLSYSGLSQGFWGEFMAVVRLPDPKLKTLGERGIECIFIGYVKHSKAFRFSSVPRPSQRYLVKGTEDSGGLVVPEKVIDEIVQQSEPQLRKSKRHRPLGCKWIFKRKLKVDETIEKFKARLVIQVFKQKSGVDYFDTYAPMDVKITFLNGELEDEVYMNQLIMPGNENKKFDESGKRVITYLYVDDMLIFGTNQVQVDLTKKFLSSRVIGCLMYAMTCTRPDIALSNPSTQDRQAIQRVLKYLKKTMDYRLMYTRYPSAFEGYTDASWISNTEDNSSTSGWVFLLGGGAISWASKKQSCITGLTIESKFVALAATAYSQMYFGKSRHLGVRHSMIRELITNEVIIPRICLELAKKEDEVVNFLMVNFFKKVLSRSMNKEEPPMNLFIPLNGAEGMECTPEVTEHPDFDSGLKGIYVYDEVQRIPSESNPSEEVSSAG